MTLDSISTNQSYELLLNLKISPLNTIATDFPELFWFTNHPKNPNVMNPRVFKIANFFAFNLLFFALYLNFIHKGKNVQQAMSTSVHTPVAAGTVSTGNSKQYVQEDESAKTATTEKASTKALKLSFN